MQTNTTKAITSSAHSLVKVINKVISCSCSFSPVSYFLNQKPCLSNWKMLLLFTNSLIFKLWWQWFLSYIGSFVCFLNINLVFIIMFFRLLVQRIHSKPWKEPWIWRSQLQWLFLVFLLSVSFCEKSISSHSAPSLLEIYWALDLCRLAKL